MTTRRIPGRRFLHSPGPTPVPEAVAQAMTLQPMDLADPRVDETIHACEQGLREWWGAEEAEVFLYIANGHGAWEAVIANLLGPGRQVLVVGTGHFSENWAMQCEAFGTEVVRTDWRPGWPADADAVREALQADTTHRIVAVFAVHTDTASGVTNDLAALRGAIDDAAHPALFVVDMVASLGAVPFHMQRARADVVLAASQKAMMMQPGLAMVAANARALAVAQANPAPRFYWDWERRRSPLSYRKFCGTPPHALLAGLRAALGLLQAEGAEQVHARHRLLAGAVQAAVQGWAEGGALGFFCRDPAARSVSVTTITVAEGIDPEAIRTLARERFQVAISSGLGPLAGRVLRIGHMGDHNAAMILGCLSAVEASLQTLGIAHGGGVRAAQAWLAQHAGD